MAIKMKEEVKKELVSTRTVLWYLVFAGFAVNYMIRINLNIAIVSMVKPKAKNNNSLTSECLVTENSSVVEIENSATINKLDEIEGFEWNEYEQGLILGSFFWLHWSTQVPGGLLANKYGTKLVFGLANFSATLFCFLMPFSAFLDYKYLIVARIIQGLIAGFAWPAMHTLTAKWIPPNERSKFVTAYLGSSVGAALTYPMCGYIIDAWGWELVFYVSGVLGTIWYIAWYFLVFDSPCEHPRITQNEKEYILNSLGESVSKKKAPVPWKDLLTSVPVWMTVIAQWGGLWGLFTLMTHAPTYLKMIHGWNIKATGFLSGMPHLLRMMFAYVFSLLGDYLLTTNKMSRTNVRKLATVVTTFCQGFCMLGLAYSGCNHEMAIIFLTAATVATGAVSTGPLANIVDLTPNYASILLGMANGSAALNGFISPTIVGYLTLNNQTAAQWQKVFWISTVVLFIAGLLYIIFATSNLQSWNSPDSYKKSADCVLESELVTLKKIDEYENQDHVLEEERKEEKSPASITVNDQF